MAKKISIFLFYILLVGNLIVFGFAYVKKNFSNPLEFLSTADKHIETSNKIELPIPLNNIAVTNAYLGYNFSGLIKEIRTLPESKEIILDSSKDLPKFIATQDTQTFRTKNSNEVNPAKMEDLQSGLRVSLSATYDLKSHEWTLRSIHIIE